MKLAMRSGSLALGWAILAAGIGWGEAIPPAPPVPEGLTIGFSATSRARLPLEEYQALNPAVGLKELSWPRSLLRLLDTPLPEERHALPPVLVLHAGDYAEDVRRLAERRLLEPIEPLLPALGIQLDEFSPAQRAAFSHRGTLYAIPHHVRVPVIRFWREAFGGIGPPAPESWEELLALGKSRLAERGTPGAKRALSLPLSSTRFAALVAMACGEPPLDAANPVFFQSARFEQALRWVLEGQGNGLIQYRQLNTPVRPEHAAVFAIDYVDSLMPDGPFGLLPFPRKLRGEDTPGDAVFVAGFAEGLALRSLAATQRDKSMELLRWLTAQETEWRMFERTNLRTIADQWLLDNTHLPLRASTLQSLDFDYAQKKFPDFAVLREQNDRAVFSQIPAPLEEMIWELAEGTVDYLPKDADIGATLAKLTQSIVELVRNTAVPTVEYAEY